MDASVLAYVLPVAACLLALPWVVAKWGRRRTRRALEGLQTCSRYEGSGTGGPGPWNGVQVTPLHRPPLDLAAAKRWEDLTAFQRRRGLEELGAAFEARRHLDIAAAEAASERAELLLAAPDAVTEVSGLFGVPGPTVSNSCDAEEECDGAAD